MNKRLPIHETFHSFQGEGFHMGKSAYFIRTYGCPIHCPWCDSAGTWKLGEKPPMVPRKPVDELVEAAVESQAEMVVITGGEPAIHDLHELTGELHKAGIYIQLETSGAFAIQGDFDWITLSPKRYRHPLQENLDRANELKLIIESENSIEFWLTHIPDMQGFKTVWLHPEWSQHQNQGLLNAITTTVKTLGAPFRAGWQIHKPYSADELPQKMISEIS